jgi:peptide/nickel transport system permease protein
MAEAAAEAARRPLGARSRAWKAFRRNRPALVGLSILVLLILVSLLAPFLTPYDPDQQALSEA